MTVVNKQGRSLAVLYGLLVGAEILFHQQYQHRWAKLALVVVIVGIVAFWRYLVKQKVIRIGLFGHPADPKLSRNERRFLYGLAFLFAPIFKLRPLSSQNVLLSLGLLLLVVFLSFMDERYFAKNNETNR